MSEKSQHPNVPLWAFVLALALAGLGWMAGTFALGRVTSDAALKVTTDFLYVVAQALFVGSTAGILFRYLVRRTPERNVEELGTAVENVVSSLHQSHTGPFVTKEALPPIRGLIESADEFFYVGGNCRALLQGYPHDFHRWAKSGKRLIFLIQDPDNEGLQHSEMPCASYEYSKYVEDSRRSIQILRTLAEGGGAVELYLTKMTPTQSLAFANAEKPDARLSMFLHLPDGESNTAPCIAFSRLQNPFWYDLFYSRYRNLRERSRRVIPGTTPNQPATADRHSAVPAS